MGLPGYLRTRETSVFCGLRPECRDTPCDRWRLSVCKDPTISRSDAKRDAMKNIL